MMSKIFSFLLAVFGVCLLNIQPNTVVFHATMAPALNDDMEAPATTVSMNLSFEIHPSAIELIETVSTNCVGVYEKFEPLAKDLLKAVITTEYLEVYNKFQPLAKEAFDKVSTEFYKKSESFIGDLPTVPYYSLFSYGRVEMIAVESRDSNGRHHHPLSTSTPITIDPLNITNVTLSSNVTNMTQAVEDAVDGMMEMGSSMMCWVSKSMSEIISWGLPIASVYENCTMIDIVPTRLGSGNCSIETAEKKANAMLQSKNMTCDVHSGNHTTVAFHSKNNLTSAASAMDDNNITVSENSTKWYMISNENVTPTSTKVETPVSDPLPSKAFDLARDLMDAFSEEWELFYDQYQSFLPSGMTHFLKATKKSTDDDIAVDESSFSNNTCGLFEPELVLGFTTHLSSAPLEMPLLLAREALPSSRVEEDLQDEMEFFNLSAKSSEYGFTAELLTHKTILQPSVTKKSKRDDDTEVFVGVIGTILMCFWYFCYDAQGAAHGFILCKAETCSQVFYYEQEQKELK